MDNKNGARALRLPCIRETCGIRRACGGEKRPVPGRGYRCCVDSEYYRHRGEGDTERAEFLYYEVESGRNHEIGDSAWYRRQKRYIFEKRAELEGGVLKFSYKLGGKCRAMRAEQPNRNIAGASLTGVVERDEKEAVYVRLDIDGKGGKAAHPYPWCPATGSMAYCMPQPGTKVSVYFSDCNQYPRYQDTEAKILEDIASYKTDSNVSGTTNLYSELPCCQSCTNITMEFRRRFPNIELNIFVK